MKKDSSNYCPFKQANDVSYTGNREQLERYAAELVRAGFNQPHKDEVWREDTTHILTYDDGEFIYSNFPGRKRPLAFPSDQFAEALAAATKPAE